MTSPMTPFARIHLVWIACLLALAACSKKEEPAPAGSSAGTALERLAPMEVMARGARLYQENCAICHGPEAQGHPDWQTPGIVVAPPLNGTGNDWKRKHNELVAVIKKGVKRKNEQIMPAWEGRLTEQDIEDVIIWFQALWPADVYDRWRKANAAAVTTKG
jgi:mono/diheme cytochrome c family protein